MKAGPNVNIPALAAGVTSLFTLVGALTATGALGRIERNAPNALTAAVILVLLGAVMLFIAGLPVTTGSSELFASLIGVGLTIVGIAWALTAGIRDAGEHERPELRMSVDAKGQLVKGNVKVGNLHSRQRLTVLVEGLSENKKTNQWNVSTLAQYYVGPDGDGKVDMPVKVPVPPKGYTSVGIRAWPDGTTACKTYPKRAPGQIGETFQDQIDAAQAGCVVLPLPSAEAASTTPVAAAASPPTVTLKWIGKPRRATRVRLKVSASGTGERVVLLAAGRRRGATQPLLRSVNPVGKDGRYQSSVRLRVGRGFKRVCARADLLAKGDDLPPHLHRCPLARSLKAGNAGAELPRPG